MKSRILIVISILLLCGIGAAYARTTATFGQQAVGQTCSKYSHATDFDTIAQCNNASGASGTKQTAPLIIGTVTSPPYAATTCDANKAGMLQWTGSGFQGCNGTAWSDLGTAVQGAGEIGEVKIWPAGTVPTGYLECNGAAVSRATYSELFAVIGTMYGAGDGTTTFNLPDYRGEFLRGFANGSTNDPDAASRTNRGDGTIGDNVGTKQTAQYASHTHSVDPPSTASAADTTHTHAVDPPSTASGNQSADHTHSVDPPATTSGTVSADHAHIADPPNTATTSNGAHTHTIGINFYSTQNRANGSYAKGIHNSPDSTTDSGGAHTHTMDIAAFWTSGIGTNHTHDTNIAAFTSAGASVGHTHTTDIGSFTSGVGSSHAHAVDIASFSSATSGGTETRPRNVSVMYIIRYQKETVQAEYVGALTPQNFQVAGDATSSPVSFNATAPVTLTTTVGKIQGRAVASTAPTDGQTLIWSTASSTWVPGASSLSTLGLSTASASPYRTGEVNTGLYSPASGSIGVVASGTETVRFTSTSVGIGTTGPGVTLDVLSTTPSTAVHPNRAGLSVRGEGTNVGGRIQVQSSGTTETPYLITMRSRGTLASPTAAQSGDALGSFYNMGYDGTIWSGSTSIGSYAAENWTSSARGAHLVFYTTSTGSTSMAERMRISSNGYVGIGTTSPSSTFHISSAVGNQAPSITYHAANAWSLEVAGGELAGGILNASPYSYWMQARSNANAILPMSLNPLGGNVGIHNSAPAYPLDVTGVIRGGREIVSASSLDYGNFRAISGNYGAFLRNDGSTYYLLFTNSGDQYGAWSTLRPFAVTISNGYVAIGTAPASYQLHVNGTAYATGAAGALSDIRHKKDVKPLDLSGLDVVSKLKPVTYFWKDPRDNGMKGEQLGFIAQEVEAVLPHTVMIEPNEEKTKNLKYNEFIPVLTKAVQELKTMFDELKATIAKWVQEQAELKAKVASQATEIEKLKAQNVDLLKRLERLESKMK